MNIADTEFLHLINLAQNASVMFLHFLIQSERRSKSTVILNFSMVILTNVKSSTTNPLAKPQKVPKGRRRLLWVVDDPSFISDTLTQISKITNLEKDQGGSLL